MLINYIKIAFRNLLKHKFYTLINVMGLAVGLASCLLIFFWVQDELSNDSHYKHSDRIYRLYIDDHQGEVQANVQSMLVPLLKAEFPEIEQAGRYRKYGSALFSYGEKTYKEHAVAYADSTLMQVLGLNFLKGGAEGLKEPNGIVISESAAEKIFGREEPIGKLLIMDQDKSFLVNGIFQDLPENSHVNFSVFASIQSMDEPKYDSWSSFYSYVYVLLREGADPKAVEDKFPGIRRKYLGPLVEQWTGKSWDEILAGPNPDASYHLEAVRDIHLYSELDGPGSDHAITMVYVFSSIAIIILLIACINYTNLATARSVERSKEVGIRKVLGAYRGQLYGQFIAESFILSFLALLLALFFVELSLPVFNDLVNKSLSPNYWAKWDFIVMMIGLIVIVSLLAGSYPAFYLSTLQPFAALKGGQENGMKGGRFRNILVVFQFSVSIFLIVGTVVIYKQLIHLQRSDSGFEKEQVLALQDAYALGQNLHRFKEESSRHSLFKSVSNSGYIPVENPFTHVAENGYQVEGEERWQLLHDFVVDYDYLTTYSMEIAEGRFFSSDFATDSTAVVINEAAVRAYRLENPIGKRIRGGNWTDPEIKHADFFPIIGVVKDFNFQSLKNKIDPMVMHLGDNRAMIAFRMQENAAAEAIAYLQQKWNKMAPGQPFNYTFLDDQFDRLYKKEAQTGKILATFSGLAIFIACLGLFALAGFTAEQRKKEIGIRKVLGSSVASIVILLSKDFGKLILIAFVIACPISWWVMNDWLEGFAYRTSIGVGVFVIAAGLSFVVAWLTMSYHAIKAATDDPVNSIRYE